MIDLDRYKVGMLLGMLVVLTLWAIAVPLANHRHPKTYQGRTR